MCDINNTSFYQHSASKSCPIHIYRKNVDMLKIAYIHTITCMIMGIVAGLISVVEITVAGHVSIYPMSANVTILAVGGQVMSLIAPISAIVLTAQMKRRLGGTPEEAVSTVTMLIIVTLLALTLNTPPVVQACYNSTVIALEEWVWIILYTMGISMSLLAYAGAISMFVIPTLIDEDEKG